MRKKVEDYLQYYHGIESGNPKLVQGKIPGGYFIGKDILMLPTNHGDARYPYGADGFNYWTYASGYIHCNEGLFSPFLRSSEGAEPKTAFYVGIKGENHKFSCMSVPMMTQEPEGIIRFTVFSQEGTYYITETDRLITALLTYVNGRDMHYRLLVMNKDNRPVQIFTSAYFNPFLKNALAENSTDRWFRQVRYKKDEGLGYFVIETYEEGDRDAMKTNYGKIQTGVEQEGSVLEAQHTTSRYTYVGGGRSSLHTAKAFIEENLEDTIHATSFTETGICGDMISYRLDENIEYYAKVTYHQSGGRLTEEKSVNNHQTEEEKEKKSQSLIMDFAGGRLISPTIMNGFMHHLKEQVTFCSEIKGFIQLSHFSLIGIRDIFQALEAYVFYEPQKAKMKMLEALDYTSISGQLPRQYSLAKNSDSLVSMDLRPFIDQGVWVISTIMTYLRVTKDWNFLQRECAYYDFVDVHKHIAQKSHIRESVLMHMIRIINYLLDNRDHENTKCVLALYGDWNDALDGLGRSQDSSREYGTGVSVMATLQVYQNLNEMLELLEYLEREDNHQELHAILKEHRETYLQAKQEISEGLLEHAIDGDHIIHGWGDQRSYLVGSRKDPDGLARDGLTSQAFWILSGFIEKDPQAPQHIEYILNAYKRLDSKYGYKTFEPYFEKGTPGVGRIPNLPKGTAENGAAYIHASMFAVMSLFALGQGELAWKQLEKLLPFTHEKISVSPFVLPNSYGENQEFHIDGESMQDWQTGSSNVLLKLMVRFVFGFEPQMEGITIQPSAYQIFENMSLEIQYLERKVQVSYKGIPNKVSNKRVFKVNGIIREGCYDPHMKIEKLFIADGELLQMSQVIMIEVVDC